MLLAQVKRLRECSGIYTKLMHFMSKELTYDYLYGVNVVEAAIYARRRILSSLFVSDSDYVEVQSRVSKLIIHARDSNLPVIFKPRQKLSHMVRGQPHQNLVLQCSEFPLTKWELHSDYPIGIHVFCDQITDPQNMGAILRSSHFFGVRTIFTRKKNSCPLNSTVAKASVGALEFASVVVVGKDEQFMREWKEKGGVVLITSVDPSKNLQEVSAVGGSLERERNGKILVVLGSEGEGVSPHLDKHADYFISIAGLGNRGHPFNLVDSLNVNSAASIILYELTKKRIR